MPNFNQKIKTLKDIQDITDKKVLVRVDYNVPIKDGIITDDTRLRASLPTIKYLLDQKAKVILMSHMGRPDGTINPKYSLEPIAKYLGNMLGQNIIFCDDCIGENTTKTVENLKSGDIALLENLRFYAEEENNDSQFAQKLANLGDIYINDAFGAIHRAHASTAGIAAYMQTKACGLLVQKELEELGGLLERPERPFVSIIGGSKVSSKIDILKSLIQKSDAVIVGGGMSYTFIKAQGGKIGKSICENDKLDLARELLELADKEGTAIILPADHLCIRDLSDKSEIPVTCIAGQIPDDLDGLDIGPESIMHFTEQIRNARTVLWNGPVGMFEDDRFAAGSCQIAKCLVGITTSKNAKTVIGGGDSAAAMTKFGYGDSDVSHISTGGGASLEFLSGVELPGISALEI